jgi:hypothetical protein
MNRTLKAIALAATALAISVSAALATPSTQIWIPSTDTQAYGTFHFGLDSYMRAQPNDDGTYSAPVNVVGLTAGVLPFEKITAEVGVDLISMGSTADNYPAYFNAKLATPENSLFEYSPALAVGGYNFGTKTDVTDQNIVYALAAKTIGPLGRFSAGWYWCNDEIFAEPQDDNGVLLSWDRTLSEISDKLWVAVDYQGGNNAIGALSFGAAWAFAKNTSVILGYDIYNDKDYAGENTYTVQVDINFP